jgi:hypothetical protein
MFFNLPQNTPAISYTAEYDQSLLIAVEHDLHFARVYLVTSVFNEEMVVDEDDTTVRDDSMINTIKNKILIQSIKFYGDNPTQMEYIYKFNPDTREETSIYFSADGTIKTDEYLKALRVFIHDDEISKNRCMKK